MTETTDAEHDLLCHLYKTLCDDIPNCGCNEPDAAFKLVHDIMLLAPLHSGTWVKARELIGSDGAFQIVLAAMTDADLLEHGGSMGGSWLGKRGRWFLWAVEQAGGIDGLDEKLETAGFPHASDRELQDMQPCTDACWVVPDGWEPPPAPGMEPDPPEPSWQELLGAMNPVERGLAEDMMRADLDFTLYGNGPRPGDDGFQFGGLMAALGMELPTITAPYPKAAPPGPPRQRYDPATKTWSPA